MALSDSLAQINRGEFKKSAMKTFQILTEANGDEILSRVHVFEWHKWFSVSKGTDDFRNGLVVSCGKVPKTGRYRRLGSRASQPLTSLYPVDREVTGAVPKYTKRLNQHSPRHSNTLSQILYQIHFQIRCGHGSLVVRVTESGRECREFEPSTAEDPPCMEAMHAKSVVSSNVLPLTLYQINFQIRCGRGSLVVKVTDSWPECHEFEPSTAEDPPCMEAMHVKSVVSSKVLPLV
ncbi:hypothetical protein TNCV_1002401 [Trichonephila clavipes]|nr:hypothetical protein TNCV_1002401 [Trichonephila clavipes]